MKRNLSMSRLAAALGAVSMVLASPARAAETTTTETPAVSGAPSPEFTKLDTNRDGYLSRAEAKKLVEFDKAFTEADANNDGRLDPAEFAKAQAIHERQRAAEFVDDSVITAKVKTALLKDPVVSGMAVSVETHKGMVLLSGFVNSEKQSQRASELAAAVGGVVTVKNSLVVKG